MSHASERDLLARSLSGNRQSRVELYKRFVYENSQIRQLGARYPNIDDFLQDCFTNVLRSSHTFKRASRLNDRVETLALWTALERDRLRERDVAAGNSVVRMCAAFEGDSAANRLASYVPPRSGSDDSFASRISSIIGEMQFKLVSFLAVENATWERAAAAAGRPVTSLGPVLVRAVDRLSRLFGAPPPLNADLESVFSEVSGSGAVSHHADPSKLRGRVISMQLDPEFYQLTPALRKIGFSVSHEVRTMTLWDAAKASSPPGEALKSHLANCRYCSELLRSILLMQRALLNPKDDFLLCPGAATLLQDSDTAPETLQPHLDACPLCRDERMRAFSGEQPEMPPESVVVTSAPASGRKVAWAAVALVLFIVLSVAGFRYFSARKLTAAVAEVPLPDTSATEFNPKYRGLAQILPANDDRVLASVLPRDQRAILNALVLIRQGDLIKARIVSEQIANRYDDPGARMLFAENLYGLQYPEQGYREMQKAEAMPPRNSYRCWATLQCALMAGDRAIAVRELGHLAKDKEFADRAKSILAGLQAIK